MKHNRLKPYACFINHLILLLNPSILALLMCRNVRDEYIYGQLSCSGSDVELTLRVLDSECKYLADVDLSEGGYFYLDSLKKGTYYLEATISGSGTAGGWIEMCD